MSNCSLRRPLACSSATALLRPTPIGRASSRRPSTSKMPIASSLPMPRGFRRRRHPPRHLPASSSPWSISATPTVNRASTFRRPHRGAAFLQRDRPAGLRERKASGTRPVMPVAATPTTHPQIMYVLSGANSPQLWRVDATMAKVVRNLPPPLFGGTRNIGANARETNDQSWYDMAVAVDPSNPQQVFIGGSVEYGTTDWDASLYRGRSPAAWRLTISLSASSPPII